MTQKIVINSEHGGFALSKKAQDMYCASKGIDAGKWNSEFGFYEKFDCNQLERDDPVLVQIVETLGTDASGDFSSLKIVEIPEDVKWIVEEYDGAEWVAESHRTWF